MALSNLSPLTTYRFLVYAENGASIHATGQFIDITVTTEASGYISLVITEDGASQKYDAVASTGAPNTVANVRALAVKSTEVVLAWDAKEADSHFNEIPTYEVKYYERGSSSSDRNANKILTNKEEAVIANLKKESEYAFQVRTKTGNGWAEYSKPVYISTGQLIGNTALIGGGEKSAGGDVGVIAGVSITVIILIIAVVSIVVLYRRRRTECNKKQLSDCDKLYARSAAEGKW